MKDTHRASTGNRTAKKERTKVKIPHDSIRALVDEASSIKKLVAKTGNSDEKTKKGMRIMAKRMAKIEKMVRYIDRHAVKTGKNLHVTERETEAPVKPERAADKTLKGMTANPYTTTDKTTHALGDRDASNGNTVADIQRATVEKNKKIVRILKMEIAETIRHQRKLRMHIKSRRNLAAGGKHNDPYAEPTPPEIDPVSGSVNRALYTKERIRVFTGLEAETFEDLYKRLARMIRSGPDAVHFAGEGGDRKPEDQGKLSIRHALFLSLLNKVTNMSMTTIENAFFVEKEITTRYLRLVSKYDDDLYMVTPNNITRYVATLRDGGDRREIILGEKVGEEMSVFGMRTIVVKQEDIESFEWVASQLQLDPQALDWGPEDVAPMERLRSNTRSTYSIAVLVNKNGHMVSIGTATESICRNVSAMATKMINFRGRQKEIANDIKGKKVQIRRMANANRYGILEYFLKDGTGKPGGIHGNARRPKGRTPTESLFAHVKNWKIMSGSYEGTTEEFRLAFNAVCGIHNMLVMQKDGTYDYWCKKIQSALNM